jgi:glycosyltransferase involved in cell wall biosynthesis
MKLLHVIASVDPLGGGPIQGVRQYGLRLPELGHSLEVVSLDSPGDSFVREFPLPVHALGPSSLGRYSYSARLVPWLRAYARNYDAVVIDGLWQYHAWATWRALRNSGVPYFVFTHGMLDPWFKRTYPLKHLKKWIYWPWADYRVLRDAKAVLFTSEDERQLARQSFWLYRANEMVVAYGAVSPPPDAERLREVFFSSYPEAREKRLLLFLGRIHEKKGCDLLIECFAGVADQHPDLHLVMAGPDQTGWVSRLKERAQALGIARRITWPGMLQGDLKWGALYSSEVFVLPSHQENFGIAVAEALGCGLPVVISDKVNIWREIQEDKAGLVSPDTFDGTLHALQLWLRLSAADRLQQSANARRCFTRRYTIEAMANSLANVIEQSIPVTARSPQTVPPDLA